MLVSQVEQVCVDAADWSGCVIFTTDPQWGRFIKKTANYNGLSIQQIALCKL